MKALKIKSKLGEVGDMATEWWTSEDWENHAKRVEELKASGEYGKEVEIEIAYEDHPLFDHVGVSTPTEPHRFTILNFKRNDKKEN